MTTPRLADVAAAYATTITAAVTQEYPNALRHVMHGPGDTPTPRAAHPAFYGCFDWHSAVEMHWALVRLLRAVPGSIDAATVREVLDEHLTEESGRIEAAYLRGHPGWERPYGWGWLLTLVAELHDWRDDPDARRWGAALRPVADVVEGHLLSWLPKLAYAERVGAHANTAFALARSLPWARQRAQEGSQELRDQIGVAADRLFGRDADYPAGWEPGGADFLSGALAEAELMWELLPAERFTAWLDGFLPRLRDGQPASLFTPAVVSDSADGQLAHLHGLNLHRGYGFDRLAGRLPATDPRVRILRAASERHAAAALPVVTGSDWMVEHWLAAYAILLLG